VPSAAPRPAINPLGAAAAAFASAQRVVWSPRSPPNPFVRRFSPLALLLLLAFLAASGYYYYVRITKTLGMGSHTWCVLARRAAVWLLRPVARRLRTNLSPLPCTPSLQPPCSNTPSTVARAYAHAHAHAHTHTRTH
jgi:hypothetical protein